jgi:two-component system, sensor histidine kinase and response regulator
MEQPGKALFQKHILVVDDNPRNLQLISTLVSDAGYKVSAVNSGHNALKFLAHKKPDVVLLDVMMPEMNGYDVCKAIKTDETLSDIPVIFLTAKNEAQDIVTGFSLGAVDYITKPFKTEEVLVRLSTHLQLKQSKQMLLEKNNELEKLNRELIRSKEIIREDAQRLAKINAEKDRFFSIIAHDLRGPFSGCMGLTEIIATNFDSLSKEEMKEYALTLFETAGQLNKLLVNLLDWARMQMGMIGFNPESGLLHHMIEESAEMYRKRALKKNISLNIEVAGDLTVMADPNMLNTVVRNLLSNAVKFTHPEGVITLKAEKTSAGKVLLTVKDSGIGIPPQILSNLYQIDKKVSRPGTSGEQSTGLGLLICRDFVRQHGEDLQVESTVGKGSTFRFELPLAGK